MLVQVLHGKMRSNLLVPCYRHPDLMAPKPLLSHPTSLAVRLATRCADLAAVELSPVDNLKSKFTVNTLSPQNIHFG